MNGVPSSWWTTTRAGRCAFRRSARSSRRPLARRRSGIEHIGSTAVPGLAAKPIIDVLVTVADIEDEPRYLPALQRAGYVLRVREPGHRMVRTPGLEVHVHIWPDGDPAVTAYLAFRNRLRSSIADRDLYAVTKRRLAQQDWPTMDHYADAKSDVILQILSRTHS